MARPSARPRRRSTGTKRAPAHGRVARVGLISTDHREQPTRGKTLGLSVRGAARLHGSLSKNGMEWAGTFTARLRFTGTVERGGPVAVGYIGSFTEAAPGLIHGQADAKAASWKLFESLQQAMRLKAGQRGVDVARAAGAHFAKLIGSTHPSRPVRFVITIMKTAKVKVTGNTLVLRLPVLVQFHSAQLKSAERPLGTFAPPRPSTRSKPTDVESAMNRSAPQLFSGFDEEAP